MPMVEEVLTIKDIAEILKLAEETVYSMATNGELPAFKVRDQRRVQRTDFERWMADKARKIRRGWIMMSVGGHLFMRSVCNGNVERSGLV